MKKFMVLIAVFCTLTLFSCATHIHEVGAGAQGTSVETARQWYVLWGLVPINEVDSKEMAGDAQDYTIKTEATFLDGIISIFTGIVTVNSRTVEVKK